VGAQTGTQASSLSAVTLLIAVLLAICTLVPRLIATDVFVTTDELFWLGRSGTFARALAQGRFDQTILTGHPGVPTMWSAVAGLGVDRAQNFAGARREVSRREVSEHPDFISALARARQAVGLVTGIAALLIAALTWRLFGAAAGIIAGGMLAFEPFMLAHSRLLHIDAELSSLTALALLAAIAGWTTRGSLWLMAGSGVATGLALLAKAPASLLLGVIPLLGLFLSGPRPLMQRRVWMMGLIWAAVTVVTYVAVWPAMWAAPSATLGQVLAFMRDNTNPAHALGPIGEERASVGPLFYVYTLLLRASPITLAGVILAVVACLMIPGPERREWRRYVAAILGFSLVFGLMMTFAAKNFDRYLLPIFPLMEVVSGFGWAALTRAIAGRSATVAGVIFGGVLLLQAAQAYGSMPYGLTYFNPLAGGGERGARLVASGWGEGLNEVADYLNAQSNTDRLRIGMPGEIYTTVLGSQTRAQVMPAEAPEATAYDFPVVYIRNRQLGELPTAMDETFLQWQPEKVVRIQDIDYAWIYYTHEGAPVSVSLADGSVLLGYTTSTVNLRAGQSLQLSLFWKEPSSLRAVEGKLSSADSQGGPSRGANLTTEGTAADLARVVLDTSPNMPAGTYVLSMRLLNADGQPIQGDGSDGDGWVRLRSVELRADRR
jgi:hypothetical protein